MTQNRYLKNPSSKNFVIIAPKRQTRPDDHKEKSLCPFCPGNEEHTPQEIARLSDSTGWEVRVFPNKYPITEVHEIIVTGPEHDRNFFDYDRRRLEKIFNIYLERYKNLKKYGQVIIFQNHGKEAGESREHTHTQVCVVPKEIFIRELPAEPVENIVHESKHFLFYLPSASSWPLETLVLPKKRQRFFGETTKKEIEDLSENFVVFLRQTRKAFGRRFPFNFYIYHDQDWYLRFIPREKTPAGFELASGIFVNTDDPKTACQEIAW